MFFGDAAGKIHKRSVHERRHDENAVTENQNLTDGIPRKNARKRKQVEHDHVNQLAHQRRAVIAQPQVAFLVTELLFGPFPDSMVSPHIVHFADRVCKQTRKHHTRRIRENGADGFRHRIALSRDVQEPTLRNQNERDVRKDADFDAAASLFFAKNFAHDISRQKRRSEDDVAKCGVESKCVNENEYFDVSGNRANDRPGENALLTEEAEESDEASKEHEDGGDEDKFVLHRGFEVGSSSL